MQDKIKHAVEGIFPVNLSEFQITMKTLILSVLLILTLSPRVNSQDISTIAEIYNYDEGDIFHKRYYEEVFDYWWERIYSTTIIEKYYSADHDTVFYIFEMEMMKRETYPPGWEWLQYTDTSYYTNLDSLIYNGNIDTVYYDDDLYNGRKINYYEFDNYPNTKTVSKYVNGCGRAYYSYNSYGAGWSVTELVYYLKANDEWGEPILILNQTENKEDNKINIYPNPVSDEVFFTHNRKSDVKFTVYSYNGRLVISGVINSGINSFNVSTLKPGKYFVSIDDGEKLRKGSFIKY